MYGAEVYLVDIEMSNCGGCGIYVRSAASIPSQLVATRCEISNNSNSGLYIYSTNLTFRDDNKCILICLVRTGEVLEIGLPGSNEENGELNTHESFDVTATCTTRSHLFTAKPSMDAPVIVIPIKIYQKKMKNTLRAKCKVEKVFKKD